jgi:hypothetical protein
MSEWSSSPCWHPQLTFGKTGLARIWNNTQTTAFDPKATEEQQLGRFERDFMEDDEGNSGEFGKVMKV